MSAENPKVCDFCASALIKPVQVLTTLGLVRYMRCLRCGSDNDAREGSADR